MSRWWFPIQMGIAALAWSACVCAYVVTNDQRWIGASLGLWLGCVFIAITHGIVARHYRAEGRREYVLHRFEQQTDLMARQREYDDEATPERLLAEIRAATREEPLSREQVATRLAELDVQLRRPTNLRRRLEASRARRRDQVNADTYERVAWIGLQHDLERDDEDGMPA